MRRSILTWALIFAGFWAASVWLVPSQHPFEEKLVRSIVVGISFGLLGAITGFIVGGIRRMIFGKRASSSTDGLAIFIACCLVGVLAGMAFLPDFYFRHVP
jgi:hypothetical protein